MSSQIDPDEMLYEVCVRMPDGAVWRYQEVPASRITSHRRYGEVIGWRPLGYTAASKVLALGSASVE